ncbi:MAG TPA: Lrp/AsnC ligand binding domain-containing protein [Anaerolineales bacterium]|nr:Lrp/AsnC ligand binding domain-containing protein [Anaerolineales bacterium]
MKAYILFKVRTGDIPEVLSHLKRLDGVSEANMTFGPYDIVAVVQTTDLQHLGHLLSQGIQPIPGVEGTLTCLAVD